MHIQNHISLTILTGIFLLIGMARSQTDSLIVYDSDDSVLVVANRYQTSLKNIAYGYQLIRREQIELLSNHSALEMVDIQFPSAFILDKKVMGYGVGTAGGGQLYMRGLGGKPNTGVLVLLNGHPDFMGIFGHPLPDVYGMDDIEQIEILAGPASTVFGNHAMGGVINLVTQPDFRHLAKISMEGGSYGSYKMGINIARNIGKHGLFLSVRRKKSQGHLAQTSFASAHFQAGWNYQFHPRWSLSVHGRYVPYQFDDPSRTSPDVLGIGAYGKIERGTGEIILQNRYETWQGSTQVYSNFGRHRFFDGFKSRDYTFGLSSYQFWKTTDFFSLALGSDVLFYGGQAENKYSLLPNGKPTVNEDSHELNSLAAYLVGFYQPWQFLNLKAGLRYERHSLPLTNIAPMAGASVNLHPALQVYANYQSGFRTPSLMELYLFPSANAALETEKVRSIESGLVISKTEHYSWRVCVFQNRASNLIQAIANSTPPPPVRFQNSGRANQWGFESQLVYDWKRALGLQLGYSYLDADELTAFSPRHQFKYQASLQKGNFRITMYGKYVQKLFAGNNSSQPLPDYHIVNIAAALHFRHLEIYAKLLNALDRRYDVLPDYRAPGVHANIGLNVKI